MYSRRLLLRMGQEDGLQETADRVVRAKFSLRRSEYFCLCTSRYQANFSSVFKAVFGLFGVAGLHVSNGRPLVWWYGGVKVALRIDSRDASDFAKKFDLNI